MDGHTEASDMEAQVSYRIARNPGSPYACMNVYMYVFSKYFMCMSGLPVCTLRVCLMPEGVRRRHGFPGSAVTDGGEPSCRYQELNSRAFCRSNKCSSILGSLSRLSEIEPHVAQADLKLVVLFCLHFQALGFISMCHYAGSCPFS